MDADKGRHGSIPVGTHGSRQKFIMGDGTIVRGRTRNLENRCDLWSHGWQLGDMIRHELGILEPLIQASGRVHFFSLR